MPFEMEFSPLQFMAKQALPLAYLIHADLPRPLEGGVRLRHEVADRHVDVAPPPGALSFLLYLASQLDDRRHVVHGFRRQAYHEIQLDHAPSGGKDLIGPRQEIFFGNSLVYYATEPLRTRFRRQGKAGFPDALHFVDQFPGESSHPQ